MAKKNKMKFSIRYLLAFVLIGFGVFLTVKLFIPNKNKISDDLINQGYEKSETEKIAEEFKKINGFESNKLKQYIEYYQKYSDYSINNIVFLVNNGIDKYDVKPSNEIMKILESKQFIPNNLDRYIDYYKKNETSDFDYVNRVNSNIDYEFYTHTEKTDTSKGILMIVNKYNYLENNYEPNLVHLEGYSDRFYLESETYQAFLKMIEQSKKDGLTLRAVSPYRTYTTQNNLYNNYVSTSGKSEADRFSARPGFSEHQTGLAIDFEGSFGGMDRFGETPEFKWMMKNAHKYGFILRYKEGTESITGYMSEPWHYRYVGVETAKKVLDSGLTYDEYYAYYIKNRE